mmetsp:Transcript_13665/g.32135  ORF Transcript_13665/g.32135 Transcript_13665/m.32135 type:complete len:223 (-) Transcript_13665:894-1562(-)
MELAGAHVPVLAELVEVGHASPTKASATASQDLGKGVVVASHGFHVIEDCPEEVGSVRAIVAGVGRRRGSVGVHVQAVENELHIQLPLHDDVALHNEILNARLGACTVLCRTPIRVWIGDASGHIQDDLDQHLMLVGIIRVAAREEWGAIECRLRLREELCGQAAICFLNEEASQVVPIHHRLWHRSWLCNRHLLHFLAELGARHQVSASLELKEVGGVSCC